MNDSVFVMNNQNLKECKVRHVGDLDKISFVNKWITDNDVARGEEEEEREVVFEG